MAQTLLDLVFALLCPLALCAVAWVVAANALSGADEISKIVKALTRPQRVETATNNAVRFAPRWPVRGHWKRRGISVAGSFHMRAARRARAYHRRKIQR